MPIIAVRCVGGREKAVAEMLAINVKNRKLPVQSILYVEKISGYVFVETTNPSMIREFIHRIRHAKGIVETAEGGIVFIPIEELEQYIKPKPLIKLFKVGDLVQVVRGPFKGYTGQIRRVDKRRREATLVLLDAGYSSPIIMPITYLKKLERKP